MGKAYNQIKAQIRAAEDTIAALQVQSTSVHMEIKSQKEIVRKLKHRLKKMEPREIRVSDHALVRYMERIAGIDVAAIRKDILSQEGLRVTETLGHSGAFPCNGFVVKMRDGIIITIIPK